MKIAILLSGISFDYNYRHITKNLIAIDYIFYYSNIKKHLIDFFSKNYDVDLYLSTNDSSKYGELVKLYAPVKSTVKGTTRNDKILRGLELIDPSEYEFIVITRFDIIFKDEFNISLFNFDKVNVVSVLEKDRLICDNFYLFSSKLFKPFYDAYLSISTHMHGHNLKGDFEYNFMKNENTWVADLSFYKLRVFDHLIMVVNRFDGVIAKSFAYDIRVSETHYNINKRVSRINDCSWYYYFNKAGTYHVVLHTRCDQKRSVMIGDNMNLIYNLMGSWQKHEFDYTAKTDEVLTFKIQDVHGRLNFDFKLSVNGIEYPQTGGIFVNNLSHRPLIGAGRPSVNLPPRPSVNLPPRPSVNTAPRPSVNTALRPPVNTLPRPSVNTALRPSVNTLSFGTIPIKRPLNSQQGNKFIVKTNNIF